MTQAQPRIARIWRGRTISEKADAYATYLLEEGFKPLLEKALGGEYFREDREFESEFITISYWESIEAMSAFAGENPTKIHHLERDEEFLLELPESVQILEIVAGSWPAMTQIASQLSIHVASVFDSHDLNRND